MEEQPKKRSFRQAFRQTKKPEKDGAEGHFSGYGAKLMARMGWNKGEGLGKEGEGMATPIEVKLRNTKGGVGAVSELSEQQKLEARRAAKKRAEENGEVYVDSSEEERQRRKRKKASGMSGTSTPNNSTPRPKKTIYDLKAAGFEVPRQLQSIVDATGSQVNTSSLSLRGEQPVFQTSLTGRLQRELAAFADDAEALDSDATNIELESERLAAELKTLEIATSELADIRLRLQELPSKEWPELIEGLKSLRKAYPSRNLEKEAIAVIRPTFERCIAGWDPASDTLEDLAKGLQDLQIVDPSNSVSIPSQEVGRTVLAPIFPQNGSISRRSTTPFETLMLSWFSHLQTAMVHSFQPDGPSAASFLRTIHIWHPILPGFIKTRITKQIKLRCSATMDSWNARKAIKHHKESPLPQWIFAFLPYYPDIFSACKGKFRTVLEIWPIHRGVIPGIQLWKKAFPGPVDQMLVKHLLPRLAEHLRGLEIDPADQKVEIISAVLAWSNLLTPRVIAEVLHSAFFPNFFNVLHSWSSYAEAQYSEIGTWVQWWKDETLGDYITDLEADWIQAYNLINAALDLLDRKGDDHEDLPLPTVEPERVPAPVTPQPSRSRYAETPKSAQQEPEEVSFKDIVESWCAEENLLLMPLRKKDETTGMALFRIAASATGAGGVIVNFKGDNIFAQNKKDKSVWDPVGLDEELVSRAEGK
ncbi:hypothetical protein N0V90_007202 [Kalmusia sp. IMI 367209]|nr:hypothetical protein N0V90_007202 [Kalmusia sp. IMI 367209]